MGIFDSIKGQLLSVIEWENPQKTDLFYRWAEDGDEIKRGSKLIVKPGQGVIFLHNGRVEAVHTEAGVYNLKTDNIPFWTTVIKVMQNFESEHKVGIYFFWTSQFLNQKWGTKSPIKYMDPKYNIPVGLRSYGNFSFSVTKPEFFFVNVMGTDGATSVDEARRVIADRLSQPLTDLLAESGYSYVDVDRNRDELAAALIKKVEPIFNKLGFLLNDFRIESTNFDEKTQERIGRIADLSAEGQGAQAAGVNYAQMKQLEAMGDAAKNENGMAGMGVGMGVGMAFGQTMAGGMQNQNNNKNDAKDSSIARMADLKEMLDRGLISQDEYDSKKNKILSDL